MTLTEVQSQVTRTSIATGAAIDTSGITGDWTLKINVQQLSNSGSATPQIRLGFQDTFNSWTASLAGPTVSFKGALSYPSDKVKSFKRADFPDLAMGAAGCQLRLSLLNMVGGDSVTYQSWIES